jgi:hypothetical protein
MLLATALVTAFLTGGVLAQAPAAPPTASAAAPAQDIRDIRGPRPLESSWLLPALGAALSLAVVAGCASWALRRRKLRVKLPHEIALERLDSARSLMREGGSREFSIAVSSIVREYIENAFGIIATHLTTHEFLSELLQSSHDSVAKNRPLLADFLESCDLAKFGGWNLTRPAMDGMYQSARRFVVESAASQLPPHSDSKLAASKSTLNSTVEPYDSLPTT